VGVGERRSLAASIGWMFQCERAKRDMSQARAAAKLGVSQQWVSKVERGVVVPSTDTIERLFALFDLQVNVDVEPAGADLDGEIDAYDIVEPEERAAELDFFGLSLDRLAPVPFALSGRIGAFAQGVPLRVLGLDLVVADDDLDALGEVFAQHVCERWNERHRDYYGLPVHPRMPGPKRWMLGGCEVHVEVVDRMPATVMVTVGKRYLRVRVLTDIEATYPDVARVMRRVRARRIHGLGSAPSNAGG
jgi:transcriptional regulator with XRE-family HTH domain